MKFARPIAQAEKKIADRLPWLVDQMVTLAQGIVIEQEDAEGDPRVYRRAPDRQAISYLLDRILGKPTERQEHSGPEGGPIEVAVDDARAELAARLAALALRQRTRDPAGEPPA